VSAPVVRPTRVADLSAAPPVAVSADLVRHFPLARLLDVEAAWAPARRELSFALAAVGGWLENRHWNWTNKIERVERGELVLHAVECAGAVQGLMATTSHSRRSVLSPGESLVYIDYIETAPWNIVAPDHPARFGGVGKVLIGDALYLSRELGFAGRVGLHSLSQAEGYYSRTCRMIRTGRDPAYHDLVYFEYTEAGATEWLDAEGVRR
jgi:hypothetical protein